MRLLLLKTGEPPAPAEESYEKLFGDCLGAEWLEAVDAQAQRIPEGPWAGVVITGSACSTYQQLPWIAACEDFLRRMAVRGVPIFGVCFGHQLLAQTFGGKVEKCPHGWELGTTSVDLTPEGVADSVFAGFPGSFAVQQSHGDVVTALPPGAVVLARNAHWGVQAFRLGQRIWGTQFHPEFTRQTTAAAIARVAARVGEGGFPQRPSELPLHPWLLSGLQEAPLGRGCLANFASLAAQVGDPFL